MNFAYDNSAVRRQDRLLDEKRALEVLNESEFGFLALGGQTAYGIPMSYAFEGDAIWFHCAPEGEKLTCIAKNPSATFCVVGKTEVQSAKFTTLYESVMVKGEIETVEDAAEIMEALKLLLDKYSPADKTTGMKYAEKSMPRTVILKLKIREISGKKK